MRVTCAVHAGDVRLERGTLALHFDAVCGHELGVDLLADGGDDHVAGDSELLAGLDGAAAAGLVGLAEDHFIAQQLAAALLDGRGQFDEFHALVDGELQLVLVGGHELLCAAIKNGRVRAHPFGNAGSVHRSVARADNDDITAQAGLDLLFHLLHPLDDALHVALNVELAGLPCAGGHQDVRVAHLLELLNGGGGLAELYFHAVALHERDILVDGLVADAEGRDDIARHAAELALTLKDRGGHPLAAKEVRRGDTGRTAADDGDLFAVNGLGHTERRHERAIALFRGKKLRFADVDGFLVEVARALALAAVRADGAGDERQRVLLGDEAERRAVESLAAELKIFGNVLLDGAAALAGCLKAVEKRNLLFALAGGQGLDGL